MIRWKDLVEKARADIFQACLRVMLVRGREPEKAANCLCERECGEIERERPDLFGCVRVVILFVGAQ